jgi:hypothetical protein
MASTTHDAQPSADSTRPLQALITACKAIVNRVQCTCPRTAGGCTVLSATCPACDFQRAIRRGEASVAETALDTQRLDTLQDSPVPIFISRLRVTECQGDSILIETQAGESTGKTLRDAIDALPARQSDFQQAIAAAYHAGIAARAQDRPLIDNPYRRTEHSDLEVQWQRGWEQEHWRLMRQQAR